jgi:spore coat protein U-like protein
MSSAGIVFSPYDTVSQAAVDGVGTISFTCTGTGTDTLNIVFSGGNKACSPREMRNGAAALTYEIYRDSARTLTWCNVRLDVPISYATGATQTRSVPIYGRVFSGQTPTYGTHTDSLTATLKRGGGNLRSTSVPIQGSVAPTCSVAAGALAFGAYSSTTAADGTASISVNCTNTAPYQVGLAGGQNLSGTTRRVARSGGGFLNYFLHSNSTRTTSWGDGTALGAKVNGTGTGASQTLTVFGRIPAGQTPIPGSYSDSVVVEVDY